MLLLSRKMTAHLSSCTLGGVKAAIKRGRVVEKTCVIGGVPLRGVTFESLASYRGWSPAVQDDILAAYGLTADNTGVYLVHPDE